MKEGISNSSLFKVNSHFNQVISTYNWSMNWICQVTNSPFEPLSQSVSKEISAVLSRIMPEVDKVSDDYRAETIPYERYIFLSRALRLLNIKKNRELLNHLFTPSPFPPPEKKSNLQHKKIFEDFFDITGVAMAKPVEVNQAIFKQLVVVLQQGRALTKEGEALMEEGRAILPCTLIAPEIVLLNFFASLVPNRTDIASAITVAIKTLFRARCCQVIPAAKWLSSLYDGLNPLKWIVDDETDLGQLLRKAKMGHHLSLQGMWEAANRPPVIPEQTAGNVRPPVTAGFCVEAATPPVRFRDWGSMMLQNNIPGLARQKREITAPTTAVSTVPPHASLNEQSTIKINAHNGTNWLVEWKTYVNITNEVIDNYQDIFSFVSAELKTSLKKCCHLDLDPDRIYYHQFKYAGSSTKTVTGWDHVGPPDKSLTLTEKAMENFNAEERLNDDTLNGSDGIYTANSTAKYYDERNEVRLTPRVFKDVVIGIDFSNEFKQEQKDYWSKYSAGVRLLAKGQAISAAMEQCATGKLSPEGLKLLDGAIFGNVLKNSAVSLAALKQEMGVGLGASLTTFDINGYEASNIFILRGSDGKIIVYLPSLDKYYREFDNESQMKQWFINQITDPRKCEILAGHFTLLNRQDGMLTNGVLSAMRKIKEGRWGSECINIRPKTINGDPFTWLRDRMKERILSDSEVLTTSNNEVLKQQVLMNLQAAKSVIGLLFVVAPAVGAVTFLGMDIAEASLDLDQAINGDSYAQRKKAIKNLFWDGAAILFDGIAAVESVGVREGNRIRFGSRFISDEVNIFKYSPKMETEGVAEATLEEGIKVESLVDSTPPRRLETLNLSFWQRYVVAPTNNIVTLAKGLKKLDKLSHQRAQILNSAMEKAIPTLLKAKDVLYTPKGREILSLHLGYIKRTEQFREAVGGFNGFEESDLLEIKKHIKLDESRRYYMIDESKSLTDKIASALVKVRKLKLNEMRSLLHDLKTLESYDLRNRFASYLEQLTNVDIVRTAERIDALYERAQWALRNDKSIRYEMLTEKSRQNVVATWHHDENYIGLTERFMLLDEHSQNQAWMHELFHPSVLIDGKPSPDLIYPTPRYGGTGPNSLMGRRDNSILFSRGDWGSDFITGGGDHIKNGKLVERIDPLYHSSVITDTRLRENHAFRREIFYENADSFTLCISEMGEAIPGTTNPDGSINSPFRSEK
ncbi:dermonecrotic toxin domain-containing protein [Pantoea sp. App145]|uniref:dermonecrotic toxin domain-containing protein n=1 Tax=Pantoea sp. App145 TaxID=3071567 RepID=UPI003A810FE0